MWKRFHLVLASSKESLAWRLAMRRVNVSPNEQLCHKIKTPFMDFAKGDNPLCLTGMF
jgi:hypothetical protein